MTRRALLIANGSFDDGRIAGLSSPAADLARLEVLLHDPDIGGYDVTLCCDYSVDALRRRIQRFFDSADFDDLILVMISGHGIKDRRGKLHFAARDTEMDALNATSLDARFLQEQMDESAARQKILILDTCYSGAFARSYDPKSPAPAVTRDEFATTEASGKVVITATTAIQMAFENVINAATQSRFTRHLIEGIKAGAADPAAPGWITVDSLYEYICKALRAERRVHADAPTQDPQRWYFGLQGTVRLAASGAIHPAEFDSRLIKLLASVDARKRGHAVDRLYELIKAGGPLQEKARAALRDLADDDSFLVSTAAQRALERSQVSREDPAPSALPVKPSPVLSPPAPPPPPPVLESETLSAEQDPATDHVDADFETIIFDDLASCPDPDHYSYSTYGEVADNHPSIAGLILAFAGAALMIATVVAYIRAMSGSENQMNDPANTILVENDTMYYAPDVNSSLAFPENGAR